MELSQIREIIKGIDTKAPFTVCKKSLGMLDIVETLLLDSIGAEALELKSLAKDLENTSIKGTAACITYMGKTFKNIELTFTFSEEGEAIKIQQALHITEEFNPTAGLSDRFNLSCTEFSVYIDEYSKATFGSIIAELTANKINLPAEISYIPGKSRWAVEYAADTPAKQALSLTDIFTLLNINGFMDIMPVEITSLIESLSIFNLLISFDSSTKSIKSFAIGLKVEHKHDWKIFDGLTLGELRLSLGVEFEDESGEIAVTVSILGEFLLNAVKLPVCIEFSDRDKNLMVLIEGEAPVQLGSLSDLGRFIGNVDMKTLVPAQYDWGKLALSKMQLSLGINEFSVRSFSVAVQMENAWSIPGIFSVERLALEYSLERSSDSGSNEYSVELLGEMRLAEIDFAIYVKKDLKTGWTLSGYTPGFCKISINRLINGINGRETGLSLPRIDLCNLGLEYNSGAEKFKLCAATEVTAEKTECLSFEAFTAALELECEKVNGKWSFSCEINGRLSMLASAFAVNYKMNEKQNILSLEWEKNEAFHIVDFCRGLGFSGFYLPEGLDISIKSLKARLDLKNKELVLEAESGGNGKVYLKSMLINKKREFVFAFLIKMDVGLKSLPVVGEALDNATHAGIHDLKAVAVSCDVNDMTIEGIVSGLSVKKGVYLASELYFCDTAAPLNLSIPVGDNKAGNNGGLVVDINKSIGPVQMRRIQVSYKDSAILFGLDAAFTNNALSFELDGLSVGYDITNQSPSFGLSGLSVDVNTPALSIGGGFLKRDAHTYSGSLRVQMASFSLTAIGSYTAEPVQSFFVFALLKANLGGPPCFFVTGIAAAFGYNRRLKAPEIEELDKFPLLQAVKGGLSSDEVFKREKDFFAPSKGNHWFAAGVLFNSFKMIDSFALLTIAFGNDTEINLLGQSVLDIPYNMKDDPIAHAVLLLKASFKPASFLISVEAVLSNDSYVLSKDCHLTGGFAFYTWYGGIHSGDFVISLGGYSSRYKKPSHYPTVKRLGLSWNVNRNLSVKGGLYFALTPSCFMAGGSLNLLYSTSGVSAWFNAYVDMLIQWKPYYYSFDIGISIGVRVDLLLFTVQLEIGCDLSIWGPEFSGIAHVKIWCISFSIPFGSGEKSAGATIDKKEFISSFLPENGKKTTENSKLDYNSCTISASGGLIKEYDSEIGTKVWNMNAHEFEVSVKSIVPSTVVSFNAKDVFKSEAKLGVRPCGIASMSSVQEIVIERRDGLAVENRFVFSQINENVPAALWMPRGSDNSETVWALTGTVIRARSADYYMFDCKLDCFLTEKTVLLPKPAPLPEKEYEQSRAYKYIAEIAKVNKEREAMLSALPPEFQVVRVDGLAVMPEGFFISKPIIVSIGGSLS